MPLMDPLSDVLSLLKLRTFNSGGFDAGGDWAVGFGRHDGIKFYAVASGACWLAVDGVPEPMHIHAGDCILLPRGQPFRAASDPNLLLGDPTQLHPTARDGNITLCNGGGDFFSVGGYFTLMGAHCAILLENLPPVVHIRTDPEKAVLHWCLDHMRQELLEPQPGGFLIAQQLATMMLIQVLRLHLADGTPNGVGWLFALADKKLLTAISAIHANPAHHWTVQALAQCTGMSRTSFAVRFTRAVGLAPMAYLTRWRMMLAADRLTTSTDPISVLAEELGYVSEAAFSNAFKRVMGSSPRRYGRASFPRSSEIR